MTDFNVNDRVVITQGELVGKRGSVASDLTSGAILGAMTHTVFLDEMTTFNGKKTRLGLVSPNAMILESEYDEAEKKKKLVGNYKVGDRVLISSSLISGDAFARVGKIEKITDGDWYYPIHVKLDHNGVVFRCNAKEISNKVTFVVGDTVRTKNNGLIAKHTGIVNGHGGHKIEFDNGRAAWFFENDIELYRKPKAGDYVKFTYPNGTRSRRNLIDQIGEIRSVEDNYLKVHVIGCNKDIIVDVFEKNVEVIVTSGLFSPKHMIGDSVEVGENSDGALTGTGTISGYTYEDGGFKAIVSYDSIPFFSQRVSLNAISTFNGIRVGVKVRHKATGESLGKVAAIFNKGGDLEYCRIGDDYPYDYYYSRDLVVE